MLSPAPELLVPWADARWSFTIETINYFDSIEDVLSVVDRGNRSTVA